MKTTLPREARKAMRRRPQRETYVPVGELSIKLNSNYMAINACAKSLGFSPVYRTLRGQRRIVFTKTQAQRIAWEFGCQEAIV